MESGTLSEVVTELAAELEKEINVLRLFLTKALGQKVVDIVQAHISQTLMHMLTNFLLALTRVLAERQSDIFENIHRIQESAVLKQHP